MNQKSRGWFYVVLQFLLIFLLVLSPRMDSPYGGASEVIGLVGLALIVTGSAVLLFSFLKLGNSLTALPIPREQGQLVTTGLYSRVRHPIYFGLLVMGFGVILDAGYWPQIIVYMLLYALLNTKAEFEESLLREKYPQYKQYAEKTPRFFPRLGR
ncbi:MAG: isoprenylcysteine carboxylmethyltransferase family protein [Aquiluna sp.]|jgi:protein-S-isoprenylcysteine O-methyltransferase Ste14